MNALEVKAGVLACVQIRSSMPLLLLCGSLGGVSRRGFHCLLSFSLSSLGVLIISLYLVGVQHTVLRTNVSPFPKLMRACSTAPA